MRHLMLIRLDPAKVPADGPDERLLTEMNELIEEMTKAGVVLDTGGLRPAEEAVAIRQSNGRRTIVDGPYTEAKEIVGGYCLLQTRTREEAIEWCNRFLQVHGPEWEIGLEVRELDHP